VKGGYGLFRLFVGSTLVLLSLGAGPAFADLSAGLVGYYRLGQSPKVNDQSGRFNNGRAVNTTWTSDRDGISSGAASLPGTGGSYLRVDSNPDLDFGTGEFSFSIWLKFPAQSTLGAGHYGAVLIRSGDSLSPWEGPTVFADVTPGKVMFRVTATNELYSTASNLNDNTWRHYAFVREGRLLKIYINGALDASMVQSTQDVSSSAHLYLGANHVDQTAQSFVGAMDELRIYNRALALAEVQTLAAAHVVGCAAASGSVNVQANRFQVSATWGSGGTPALAQVNCGATTDQTAYFYWTDPGNTEVIVKLLDFCSLNSTWSVYANGVTDREVHITITDRYSGHTWTSTNPLNQGFVLIRDKAFDCP
jgi:hypothetical protein